MTKQTNKTQNHTRLKPRDELGLTTQEQVSTLVKVNSTPEPFSKLINEKNRKIRLCKSQIRNTRIDVKKQAWQGIEEATIIERRLLTQLSKKINDMLDFNDNFYFWTSILEKDTGKVTEIPKEVIPLLENFWEHQKKQIKNQLSELNLDGEHER